MAKKLTLGEEGKIEKVSKGDTENKKKVAKKVTGNNEEKVKTKTKKNKKEKLTPKQKEKVAKEISKFSKEITDYELQKKAEVFINSIELDSEEIASGIFFAKREKDKIQKELESLENPKVVDKPDFLTNPLKVEERNLIATKIRILLNNRFSLVFIADILQTNEYNRLDEIIKRKEELIRLVQKYISEGKNKSEKVKLFSNFKDVVGYEYNTIYKEQEKKINSVVSILFPEDAESRKKKKTETEEKKVSKPLKLKNEIEIEDVISKVIDSKDFNLACQIETEFLNYELTRIITILSDLHARNELKNLINELKYISMEVKSRSDAYSLMDRLITGNKNPRKIISKKDEEGER